jgi:nitrogen regulatory protein PII
MEVRPMKKIEAIIRSERLEDVKEALEKFDINGLSISNIMGCGLQKGRKEYIRGNPININLIPKTKIEIVVPDDKVDKIVDLIVDNARTGEIGDGKIFIYDVANAVRIRTGETGTSAI